ncbi:MAG: hypothetical protein AAGI88_09025 [Pseudomonadota bacterium]
MPTLRFDIKKDWLLYLFVANYALLIGRMTLGLWSSEGINIFSSYSLAPDAAQMVLDANKIYWSKTCFLFGTLFLFALNFDFRFAFGVAAVFWAGSLSLMFAPTPILLVTLLGAAALCGQQIWRKQILSR